MKSEQMPGTPGRPSAAGTPGAGAGNAPAVPKRKMRGWTEHSTSEGRKYYFHKKRKISQYTVPDELKTLEEKLMERFSAFVIYKMFMGDRTIYFNKDSRTSSYN